VADSAATPLVGRSVELDRVRAAIERAASAAGGTLLVAGEEGIGKSRLAAEALALARQRGFLTLSGTAYALHTDLAYAPVLEAIDPFLAALPAGRMGQLVRGLPDLSRLFGNLALPPPPPLGDPALERTRLFEAVARLVERMAAERPLVFWIMHRWIWCIIWREDLPTSVSCCLVPTDWTRLAPIHGCVRSSGRCSGWGWRRR
jgi:AAA ATPase domain